MIEVDVLGHKKLQLHHLVLDHNGTLAIDGVLLPGVADALKRLAEKVQIHIVTADTFGDVESQVAEVPCKLVILPATYQDVAKLDYVNRLGPEKTVCIGNGRNDRLMLQIAALGIAVVLREGAALQAVASADVVCTDILQALDLLTHPLRLVATLRS